MRALQYLVLLALASGLLRADPVVTQVEPPSWWPGHTLNPVRLLIRGQNLNGAQLNDARGMSPGKVQVNARGTAAFVDVCIARNARPGLRELRLTTPEGVATVPFDILAPLPTTNRFQGFGPDDFIYLILPDRFANGDEANDAPTKAPDLIDRTRPRYYHGGDLRGIIQRLPYLKDLGVTALWLNPWYDNYDGLNEREKYGLDNKLDPIGGEPIADYHGYGATDFYGVDEHLGDLATLQEFVDAAHQQGLKVIQDQVANHVGPYHPWVTNPPTSTWFHGTVTNHLENNWQTWTIPDPYASTDLRRRTLEGWFINLLPDLNQSDVECRRYLIQNALWWVGVTGLDGIRQDTLPYVPRSFWHDWSAALKRQYPRLTLLGEVFDGDPTKVAFYQTGRARFDGVDSGIDSLFDFPLYYRLRETFGEGKSIKPIAEQLARDHIYENAQNLVTFVGLHDVDRFMNGPGANRSGLKLALTFLLTSRGIPLLYYGDELGLPGGTDPHNRRDFPGGFVGDPRQAFEATGRTTEENEVWNQVRRVAHLRQRSDALRRGRLVQLDVTDQTYAFARLSPKDRVVVMFNTDIQPHTVVAPVSAIGFGPGDRFEDQLGSGIAGLVSEGNLRITVPARAVLILR